MASGNVLDYLAEIYRKVPLEAYVEIPLRSLSEFFQKFFFKVSLRMHPEIRLEVPEISRKFYRVIFKEVPHRNLAGNASEFILEFEEVYLIVLTKVPP